MNSLLIVETYREQRGHEIAVACLSACDNLGVYLRDIQGVRRLEDTGILSDVLPDDQLPARWDIVIAHYRDESQVKNEALAIWYGADGEEPEQSKEWNIHRCLGSPQDVKRYLRKRAVRELIEWALCSNRFELPIPDLLRPMSDYLSALSILCQGYLLAHCVGTEDDERETCDNACAALGIDQSELREVIERLGIYSVDSVSSEDADWWLEPFRKEGNVAGESFVESILIEIDKEYDHYGGSRDGGQAPQQIRALVESFGEGCAVTDMRMVSDAYHRISDVLI